MQIQIDQATHDFLKKTHIHFLLPLYGGQMSEGTFSGMLNYAILAMKLGVNFTVDTLVNESLISRGRNNLVAKFMANPNATHMMFIDSDIRFNASDLFRMLTYNVDIVGGIYPMKSVPIKYVVNTIAGAPQEGNLVEVSTLGTGFMMVRRNVIESMCKAYPHTKYIDSLGIGKEFEPHMFALFDTMIDGLKQYYSEDWTFCHRWRSMGGKIWADRSIKLDHIGYHVFGGNVDELSNVLTSPPETATTFMNTLSNLKLSDTDNIEMSMNTTVDSEQEKKEVKTTRAKKVVTSKKNAKK